ncbi:unnamed protein product [Mytilus coruscus]|uniref:Uncharacterized protein n=1 Tax=Mytilus coruscus TaxID=42192 RepID=A0A6J8DXV8_MYTCO|nr:unnamed protein product [Mytilus coruscus]
MMGYYLIPKHLHNLTPDILATLCNAFDADLSNKEDSKNEVERWRIRIDVHSARECVSLEDALKLADFDLYPNIHKVFKLLLVLTVTSVELSKFENTMKKIKYQNVQLKKEMDQHTEKLETELIKKWEDLHRCTEKEEKDLSLLIGSLASKKSEGEIKAYKQFDTEISNVYSMTACSEDTLWITDFKVLQKVKIERSILKIIDQKEIISWDMACTPSKDLLLADGGSILKQIGDQTGEVTNKKVK